MHRSGRENERYVVCTGGIRQGGRKRVKARGRGEIRKRKQGDLAGKGREW